MDDLSWNKGVSSPFLAQIASFFIGCILTLLGTFQLGFLVNFISSSVVNGFIQSAAFSIPLGQFKNLFGVQSNREGFIGQIIDLFEELLAGKANWYDFGVGIGSLVLLILLGKLKLHRIDFERTRHQEKTASALKFSISRQKWAVCMSSKKIMFFEFYESIHLVFGHSESLDSLSPDDVGCLSDGDWKYC